MTEEPPAPEASTERGPWVSLVLVGLLIAIVGSTTALFASDVPPCVPATAGEPTPPVTECGAAVVPYLAVAVAGVVIAAVSFRRS